MERCASAAKSPCHLNILPLRNPTAGCEASLSSTLKAVGLESAPEGLKGVTKIAATACKVGACGDGNSMAALCTQVVSIWRVCNRKPNPRAHPSPARLPAVHSLYLLNSQCVQGALQRQLMNKDDSRSQLVLYDGPQLEKTAVRSVLVCMIPQVSPRKCSAVRPVV